MKLRQTPLSVYHEQYADKTPTYWYNQKGRRMHQGKRNEYKKQLSTKNVANYTLNVEDD